MFEVSLMMTTSDLRDNLLGYEFTRDMSQHARTRGTWSVTGIIDKTSEATKYGLG
jgi:hypothetical protein